MGVGAGKGIGILQVSKKVSSKKSVAALKSSISKAVPGIVASTSSKHGIKSARPAIMNNIDSE